MMILQPDRYLLKKQILELAAFIRGRVLDIGAGGVRRYKRFFNCSEYITLDMDKNNKPDVIGSATDLPFQDNSFDSAVMTQVLGDIFEFKKALKEVSRVLKKDGYFLLTESLMNELHDEPNDFWRFTKFSFERVLEEAGFEVINLKQRGGFWAVTAQNNIRYLINCLSLYENKFLNLIFGPLLYVYTKVSLRLDRFDKSRASRQFAIGWTILARKI